MRLVIASSALRASLAIYHLISNASSLNNFYLFHLYRRSRHNTRGNPQQISNLNSAGKLGLLSLCRQIDQKRRQEVETLFDEIPMEDEIVNNAWLQTVCMGRHHKVSHFSSLSVTYTFVICTHRGIRIFEFNVNIGNTKLIQYIVPSRYISRRLTDLKLVYVWLSPAIQCN